MFSALVCGLHSPWWGALNRLPQVPGAGWVKEGEVAWMGAGPQEASCFHRDKGLSGCILGRNLSHTSWFCSQRARENDKLTFALRSWSIASDETGCVSGGGGFEEHEMTKRQPRFDFELCSLTVLDQGWFMGSFIQSAGSLLMIIITMCI